MRQFLEHATGLSIYPIISFVIFLSFFLGVLLFLWLSPKSYFVEMKNLPLADDPDATPGSQPRA